MKKLSLVLLCAFQLQAQDAIIYNGQLPITPDERYAEDILELHQLLASSSASVQHNEFFYTIKEIVDAGKLIRLEDNSSWLVNLRDRAVAESWAAQDKVLLFNKNDGLNTIQMENLTKSSKILATLEKKPDPELCPFILRPSHSVFDADHESKVILNNGLIFKGPKVAWHVRDSIFIYSNASSGLYDLWNITKNKLVAKWKLVGNEKNGSSESIFNIEKRLNETILGQQEVIQKVSATLFNSWAGLNDPEMPLGVFLFLGPTGVGKTELAKTIAHELYKNPKQFIRFDMSHFTAEYDMTRLIGSPPGYVNHEEGGQLTEAIRAQPQSVILLDEIEKAHWSIRKAFLPVFDEGFITDAKNQRVKCNRVIFIMTGNIASEEIAKLFYDGYTTEEIQSKIEPYLIKQLSPEFYNRVQTYVFRPITSDLLENLVRQKLKDVAGRLKKLREIELQFDETVIDYLTEHGYHPTLGARPLKKLIETKVVAALAYAIISEGIPNKSAVTLFYLKDADAWRVEWGSNKLASPLSLN